MKVLVLERGAALDSTWVTAAADSGFELCVIQSDLEVFRALGREDWDVVAVCGDASSITRARLRIACESSPSGPALVDVRDGAALLVSLERQRMRRAA